jgi:hypothetical protein
MANKKCNHKWRYWEANQEVNRNFKPTGMEYLVGYIGDEPLYRGCVKCGLIQRTAVAWETVNRQIVC